jgi:hypothetical protein
MTVVAPDMYLLIVVKNDIRHHFENLCFSRPGLPGRFFVGASI